MRTLPSSSNGLSAAEGALGLKISPRWARDPITLLPAKRAPAVGSDDAYNELSAAEARWYFETSAADDARSLRAFVAVAFHDTPAAHLLTDQELRRWILDRIESGQLVAVRALDAELGGASSLWRALRDLIRQIEALAPGELFRAGGRQYKLIAGIDLTRLGDRDHFELASQKEARDVLGQMASRDDVSRAIAPLLAEAREKLSRDWRPPLEPDGLLLLRRKVTNRTVKPLDAPALTPSEMVPRVEKSWIEIELVDEDGEPYAGDVELTLADGRKTRASSNAQGLVRVDGVVAGNCQVTLPDLDASSWAPK